MIKQLLCLRFLAILQPWVRPTTIFIFKVFRRLIFSFLFYDFIAYKIFDLVNTVYGTGYIGNIREDGTYIVYLTNWALAQGQSPTLYLREEALK